MKTFSDRVIEPALTIPSGQVTTYGRIAKACGATAPKMAQSITQILAKAHASGVKGIPFHRIVYANGTVWMSDEYTAIRKKLYKEEGIAINEKGKIQNFEDIVFDF